MQTVLECSVTFVMACWDFLTEKTLLGSEAFLPCDADVTVQWTGGNSVKGHFQCSGM